MTEPSTPATSNSEHPTSPVTCNFSFQPTTRESLSKIISNSPIESWFIDPLPAYSSRFHSLIFLVSLHQLIITRSLSTGVVPSTFKQAQLTPYSEKKTTLTKTYSATTTPSQTLISYISKLLEHMVASQLVNYL